MTKIKYAYAHPAFRDGKCNRPSLVDLSFMTPEEQIRLALWMRNVGEGMEHEGRNKPSWLFRSLELAAAKVYKQNNIWHYHCGPYEGSYPRNHQMTDNRLSENNDGRTSGPVYHYAKQQDSVIVIGYSRIHEPFPTSTSKSNPLRYRSNMWAQGLPHG